MFKNLQTVRQVWWLICLVPINDVAYEQEAALQGSIFAWAACDALYEIPAAMYILFFLAALQFWCGYVERDRNSIISFVE